MVRRRTVLASLGGLAVGSLAGCSGNGPSETTENVYPEYTDVPQSAEEYLSNTSNFDGSGVDRTDAEEVSVTVGARGNTGYLAFDPAVVAISPGTTVVWEWNGRGGAHNVASPGDREPLYSGPQVNSDSETYAYTFEDSGTYRYVCEPHEIQGMKGVIIVV